MNTTFQVRWVQRGDSGAPQFFIAEGRPNEWKQFYSQERYDVRWYEEKPTPALCEAANRAWDEGEGHAGSLAPAK